MEGLEQQAFVIFAVICFIVEKLRKVPMRNLEAKTCKILCKSYPIREGFFQLAILRKNTINQLEIQP